MTNPSPIAQEYLREGRSATCPIIDLHGHLGPFHGTYMPAAPLEQMRRELQKCGVKRIVCSHHTAMAYELEALAGLPSGAGHVTEVRGGARIR